MGNTLPEPAAEVSRPDRAGWLEHEASLAVANEQIERSRLPGTLVYRC